MFIAAQAWPRWFGRVFAFPPDPWRWKVKGRTVKDSEGEHSEGERRRVGVAVHIVQRNKLCGAWWEQRVGTRLKCQESGAGGRSGGPE